MKILVCHNYYQQRGGEDRSFADDVRLLESHGHCLVRYTVHNDSIAGTGRWKLARKTVWNQKTYTRVRELIRLERPDVLHCRNSFPLLSPALYYAAQAEGVPVVQALGDARCLIFPSTCYETFGRTVVEAYARGTPVIASRLGAMTETVQDGHTGLHFRPGDTAELAAKVRWLLAHPAEGARMRRAAREQYEAK